MTILAVITARAIMKHASAWLLTRQPHTSSAPTNTLAMLCITEASFQEIFSIPISVRQ
ncbi:hypothetical protein HY732_02710 [Candidatus Uhrbacteria bacterium]|nr:hypothetical protein [Candidatus Uhrbacteria bacterium]